MRLALALFFCFAAVSLGRAEDRPLPGNLMEKAKSNFEAGKFDDALALLDQLDKPKPGGESLDLRGTISMEEGKLDEAANIFAHAHDVSPDLFSPRLHLGEVFFRQRKFTQALGVFQPLLMETNILTSNEKLRYGILLTDLAAHDEGGARTALDGIKFPTETPAYYYAQAAWEFAHGHPSEAQKWINTADQIFNARATAWFARPFFDLGWSKKKPPLVAP